MSSTTSKSPATAIVERLLQIPPEPHAPAGAHESVTVFRAARGFYWYRMITWGLKQAGAIVGLIFGLFIIDVIPDFPYKYLVEILEYLGILTLLVTILVTYLMIQLDYELRWYIVTDRSLRIREGLIEVREKTMSFANIQNISIRQGPIQRLFGIADVEVRTAGGGGGSSDAPHDLSSSKKMHLGYFHGVDNAEEIRDAILKRVRELRDSGLGDEEPEAAEPMGVDLAALEAARELAGEARALRALFRTAESPAGVEQGTPG